MVDLAEIVQAAGPAYLEKYGDRMLPSHRRVIHDVLACRTPNLGGQLYLCPNCADLRPVYFSCRNRHCPKCQQSNAELWLKRQHSLLLPTNYLLGTCTLPSQLRSIARSHQRTVYSILIREAARSLLDVVGNPVFIGGRTAILAVLHTWTRALLYHPHVHMLFPAGGLSTNGDAWCFPRKRAFPVPGFALAKRFRERVRDAFVDARLATGRESVWNIRWVANVKKVGSGDKTLLYLSRYIFRTAISNHSIDSFDGNNVTFHWTESSSGVTRRQTLPAEKFIGRFLQHTLPKGFTRVRYYGLWAPACREKLKAVRAILEDHNAATGRQPAPTLEEPEKTVTCPRCPKCGTAYGEPIYRLPRSRAPP